MINLLIGPPGGGKSYEAVVYHILPALEKGRMVITNLPLDLERIGQLDASWPSLVKKVEDRRGLIQPDRRASAMLSRFAAPAQPEEGTIRAFSTMEDYAHPWRHAETGSGPLYVIDECHMAMPRGNTRIEVEEWYSLHRHESADVLLITQSYGKLSKSIVDLVQVCYRVKKGTAFGTAKEYIRKVQDGVRGDVVNTGVRKYQKRYFGLYKSHTRGGGSELEAQDIVPLWKRWPFVGALLFITLGISIFAFGPASINPMKNGIRKQAEADGPKPVRVVETVNGKVVSDTGAPEKEEPPKEQEPVHPYAGRGLHVVGSLVRGAITKVWFVVSQNGQVVSSVDSRDLIKLGYRVETPTACAVRVSFEGWSKWIICDAPQLAVKVGGPPESEQKDQKGGGSRARAGGAAASDPSPDDSASNGEPFQLPKHYKPEHFASSH